MDIEKLLLEYTENPENCLNIREELSKDLVKSKSNPFTTTDELTLKSLSELIIDNSEFIAIFMLLNNIRLDDLEKKVDKLLKKE